VLNAHKIFNNSISRLALRRPFPISLSPLGTTRLISLLRFQQCASGKEYMLGHHDISSNPRSDQVKDWKIGACCFPG